MSFGKSLQSIEVSDTGPVSYIGSLYGRSIQLRGYEAGTITLTAIHSETESQASIEITIEYVDIPGEEEY